MPQSSVEHLRQDDLIAARATAGGPGAIAIIRVDGRGTADLIRELFQPKGTVHPADAPRHAIFGQWMDPASDPTDDNGKVIDHGLTIFFRAPHSFTGNDLVELHCHGGTAVVRRLLGAVVKLGARPAQPGEFTRRAFLNGRMDLAQAESVADLIRAETDASARSARAQLSGGLSRQVESLRETLVTLAAEIEARIDFPDEGIEEADLNRLTSSFEVLREGLVNLASSQKRGKLLRDGARVALVGPPNVGKSSLLNALARSDRAIVTPHPGTTRDTIECLIDLDGIPVTLIDTAGLRESEEPIEKLGIERSRREIETADCVLEVRDATGEINPVPASDSNARRPDLIAQNKSDLLKQEGKPRKKEESAPSVAVSALTGEGISDLEEALKRILAGDAGQTFPPAALAGEVVAVNERHAALIHQAMESLGEARKAWNKFEGGELMMVDLRDALAALDEILGLSPSEAILDRVFERFCIGK